MKAASCAHGLLLPFGLLNITGLRVSEAQNLELQDVDLERRF